MTHTPGPWNQSHRKTNFLDRWATEIYDTSGKTIATAAWYPVKTAHGIETNRDANARLIAAAPDLLAACQLFTEGAHAAVRALNDASIPCPSSIALAAEKARAAIAKATK